MSQRQLPQIWLVLAVAWPGCRPPSTDQSVAPPGLTRADAAEMVVTDDLHRRVAVAQPVRRIVSLAPACTELLFAVGAGDRVIAVTTFDNFPPEAATRERIGGFTRDTISIERVVGLRPDLVVAAGGVQRDLIEELERLGLTVIVLDPSSTAGVLANIRLAGKVLGLEPESAGLEREVQAVLEEVRAQVAQIPVQDRPRTFYQLWDRPMRTVGAKSFVGQLLELAGGQNIFADLDEPYPLVSEELVIARDPQVILMPARSADGPLPWANRGAWETVTAVRQGRVHTLDEDLVSRPGPRIGLALKAMAQALNPAKSPRGNEERHE